MAGYERKTALGPAEVLERAEQALPDMVGLSKTKGSSHSAAYAGDEGTVNLTVHRHGPYTDVVASTDRLRTSRLDHEIQKFLTQLPYEPGDRGSPGPAESD